LVVEDVASHLPHFMLHLPHIIVRRLEGELVRDAQLKLRCANATHTAVVYTMALSGCTSVAAAFAAHPRLLLFLDSLYHADISSLAPSLHLPEADVLAFYTEWRARVAAPSVDMSPFWVAQNAVAKVRRAACCLAHTCVMRLCRWRSGCFPPSRSTAPRRPA
jgi:mannitol-1-phosphate/altronate dehydrogenase